MNNLREEMIEFARKSKVASRALALLSCDKRNRCLTAMADAILAAEPQIAEANRLDVEDAIAKGLSPAMVDRLRLTHERIVGMVRGIRETIELPDPLGRELERRVRPNGLVLRKISCPIGVIVFIFESRPNVAADAAALCFKSGNATILRGGKEAFRSNQLIANAMVTAAKAACPDFPENAVQVVPTKDRAAIGELLALTEFVDLCIPRGGEGLIRAVMECSRVPVIKHYKGVCHVYVHADADLEMACKIVVNAKAQRPGVCNAAETLLVDESVARTALPLLANSLIEAKVKLRCDVASSAILKDELPTEMMNSWVENVAESDWSREYLDYIISIRVVRDIAEAIAHIAHYGSGHSESIITKSEAAATQFMQAVDSAAVYWNASTRFTDGSEYGMGAEIGISTDKIGARGPMGLNELTAYKWLGYGTGQIRI